MWFFRAGGFLREVRALPLTEDRTAHSWWDQPRARQRHPRSEVHSAHITLMRADQALLDVVDIVVHSAVTERLLRGRGRGRGAAAARGCRRAASAKGCPRSVLMARAQQHRLVGEGALRLLMPLCNGTGSRPSTAACGMHSLVSIDACRAVFVIFRGRWHA
jgi:hypothetical protein